MGTIYERESHPFHLSEFESGSLFYFSDRERERALLVSGCQKGDLNARPFVFPTSRQSILRIACVSISNMTISI